ncbi:MAG: ribonuclease P protein component 1 [Thermoproteota archaeon]|nr:ribonuclease P protein component 1 [Candidatus Brockarchaeota archaeon]MBO3763167.1 ribonuclease P protein component 1 [Candidatus Brockarchaeota archaeon]MBO3768144.1 ribonuclease P protein component 1 [Candidatus Brockarchaeota archaeon]MBO3801057.1 ribonuclease P protein component 1 [Candidatus Brockarchaeota archaeon]
MNENSSVSLIPLDFIGLNIEVIESSNKSLIGLKGLVIGETMKTFVVLTDKGRKIIPKDVAKFKFITKNGKIFEIEGRKLLKRPEDRLWRCCF